MRMWQLLLFAAYITDLASAMMDVVYMDQHCGGSYFISGYPATRIKLTSYMHYHEDMDCTFTVEGDYFLEDRLMIQFKDLDTEDICDVDSLAIYDGPNNTYSKIGNKRFCGYNTPSIVYTSSGSSLTFYFKSDGSIEKSGFDIILTHFKTGLCSMIEFECDNGRCIYNSLPCNGYNPCGDHSDCKSTTRTTVAPWTMPSWNIVTSGVDTVDTYSSYTTSWSINTGGIVGATIGSVVFVFIIIIIVVGVQRRRTYMRPVQPVTMATVQTRAAPSPMSPGYNQPVPQQLQIPTATALSLAAPPPSYEFCLSMPQQSGQIPTAPGIYADQNMTSYPTPPPYPAK